MQGETARSWEHGESESPCDQTRICALPSSGCCCLMPCAAPREDNDGFSFHCDSRVRLLLHLPPPPRLEIERSSLPCRVLASLSTKYKNLKQACCRCTGRDTARTKHSILWVDGELYCWASSPPRVAGGEVDTMTVTSFVPSHSVDFDPSHSVDFDQMSHAIRLTRAAAVYGGHPLDIHRKPD
jgi:hypothetical protein